MASRDPNTPARLLSERSIILREMLSGESYAHLAYRHRTSKKYLMDMMRRYKPYKSWLLARQTDSLLMDAEIRQYLDDGLTVAFLSELYDVGYDEMRDRVHRIEMRVDTDYLSQSDKAMTKKYVTVDDVKDFKIKVNVGEMLICDETEDGVLIYCTILKKHLWYADTDMGSIDWNWLAVKNERRLFDDEIIYG